MSMPEIRKARPEDAEALREIAESAYSIYLPRMDRKPFPMLDDYAARIAAGHAHVLEDKAGIQGYVVVLPLDDGSMMLDNIAARPDRQKRGYGRALAAHAEKIAREHGASLMRVYTNEAMWENLEWYPRLGYEEYERKVENGYRRVYLRKKLA